jgi:tetratricopeptide (TPR) repeat protein
MSLQSEGREGLRQTVLMLEQILEVMPDDLFTLRALYETYLQLEEPEKAIECLKKLDDAVRAAQNGEIIAFVIQQYESIAEQMPELRKRIERLHELQMVTDLMEADEPVKPPSGNAAGIESEMALAWDLFQDEFFTQEEYSNVLHDLTEISSRTVTVPVTVLHILHDRNFSRFDKLMTHLCQKYRIPVLALSQFDEREDLREVLSLDFITRHAALPFGKVGGELLLAVLNPMDRALLLQAEQLSGSRCHPCLVTPQEYDLRLTQIKKALTA